MKIHRFIGDFDLTQSSVLIRDPGVAKQMRSVLKLHTGEKIILSNGRGEEALCELGGYGRDSVSVTVLEQRKNEAEPTSQIILYCSILKRENFEWVVQKATEVGVKEIIPIMSRRTVKLNLNTDRLERITKEASEQSGRGVVPTIHQPVPFEEALEHAQTNSINILLDSSGKLVKKKDSRGSTGLFIGPEGGWDEAELALAQERGASVMSLGTLTLRAETAAIIASYLFV